MWKTSNTHLSANTNTNSVDKSAQVDDASIANVLPWLRHLESLFSLEYTSLDNQPPWHSQWFNDDY